MKLFTISANIGGGMEGGGFKLSPSAIKEILTRDWPALISAATQE